MTTIVYRDGVLAADTRAMAGEAILPEHIRKVRRLRDGTILAFCGMLGSGHELVEHLLDPKKPGPIEGATGSIVVRPDGKVYVWEEGVLVRSYARFVARGSGKEAALGALHTNATARQAVKAAMKVDPSSGGRVQFVTLRKKRRR